MSFAILITHTNFVALLYEGYQLGFIYYPYVVFLEAGFTRYKQAVRMFVRTELAANCFAAFGYVAKNRHVRIRSVLVCASR